MEDSSCRTLSFCPNNEDPLEDFDPIVEARSMYEPDPLPPIDEEEETESLFSSIEYAFTQFTCGMMDRKLQTSQVGSQEVQFAIADSCRKERLLQQVGDSRIRHDVRRSSVGHDGTAHDVGLEVQAGARYSMSIRTNEHDNRVGSGSNFD